MNKSMDNTTDIRTPDAPPGSLERIVRPRGRKRKPGLAIEWCHDIPAGVVQMAYRRTKDMLAHYGRNITAMPIETLVLSCYLQGVEDCFAYHEKRSNAKLTHGGENTKDNQ